MEIDAEEMARKSSRYSRQRDIDKGSPIICSHCPPTGKYRPQNFGAKKLRRREFLAWRLLPPFRSKEARAKRSRQYRAPIMCARTRQLRHAEFLEGYWIDDQFYPPPCDIVRSISIRPIRPICPSPFIGLRIPDRPFHRRCADARNRQAWPSMESSLSANMVSIRLTISSSNSIHATSSSSKS